MSGLFRKSIRTRLNLLYVSLLTAVLVLYGAGTSAFFLRNLREQVDETLAQDVETVETLLSVGPDGRIRVQAQDTDEDEGGRLLEVWPQDGPLLYRSPELRGRVLGAAPDGHEGIQGARLADGTRVRIVNRMHRIGTRPVVVRLAVSEERLWQEFWEMVSVLSIGLPVAVALVGLTGYAVARRALRPLDSMAHRAEQITAERLSERLNIENPGDELGHLGRVINETLARLEHSFEQLRRFTADASLELRTPLTAIRSVGEVALQRSGDVNYYRDIVGSMLEEVNRLTRLVDSLLTMSRADAGRIPLQRAEVAVLDLAKESAGLLEVLAEEKNQKLTVEGDPMVAVRGDRVILRQALVNLIDNAVKYSPSRGNIFVRVGSNDGDAARSENVAIESDFVGVQPPSYPINTIFLFTSGPQESVMLVALKPGPSLADNRAFAEKVRAELAKISNLRDLQYGQPFNYPTMQVTVDRNRAGQFNLTVAEVAKSMVTATSSSRFVEPNFWRDPVSGNGFQIQVEIPQNRVRSIVDLKELRLSSEGHQALLRDVADVRFGTTMGEVDRYNMQRVVSLTANLHGEYLGDGAKQIQQALRRVGNPPRGITVAVRGQIPPLEETISGLRIGLLLSILVIFLLLTFNFQSLRLALTVLLTVPAVLCGVLIMLFVTGTTLNVQSFMGAIMAIGVAVANAILFVTFSEFSRKDGVPPVDAALEGGRSRARAILMTAAAMIFGMIPMALGFTESGKQTAPLARAVIGGLAAATISTLFILPSIYAILQGRSQVKSPSLNPYDPESKYYEKA